MASELRSRCEMTNQEIIETIKYLNFCGLMQVEIPVMNIYITHC